MNKVKGKIRGRPRRTDSDIDLRALGNRIRQLRGRVSQEELAQALTVSQGQLSKYELGLSAPPLRVMVRLSKKFGVSVDWLIQG